MIKRLFNLNPVFFFQRSKKKADKGMRVISHLIALAEQNKQYMPDNLVLDAIKAQLIEDGYDPDTMEINPDSIPVHMIYTRGGPK